MPNNDLISVENFIRWLDVGKYRNPNEKCFSERNVAGMLRDFALTDSVGTVPAVYGQWIQTIENGKYKRVTSCCGDDQTKITMWCRPKYCPNCGALMSREDGK